MNLRDSLFYSLDSSKEYRAGFVEEKIRTGLAAQLRTIRERLPHPDGLSRPMTQAEFAKFLGKSQSWVSRLEDPNEPIPTVPTLLLISSKLDIGLKVAFVSFAELLDDMSGLSPDTLHVPSFREDRKLFPRHGPAGELHWNFKQITGGVGTIRPGSPIGATTQIAATNDTNAMQLAV